MHLKLTDFSVPHSRIGNLVHVERTDDHIVVVSDPPASDYLRHFLWIFAAFIPAMTVYILVTSQNLSAVCALLLILPGFVVFMPLKISTTIDLADRTIKRTWKIGGYERHAFYPPDDSATAEVKDESRLIEGYSLPLYNVRLVGKGKWISIYSSDNFEEAQAFCEEITCGLRLSNLSSKDTAKLS